MPWSHDLFEILGRFGGCLSQGPSVIYTCVVLFCLTSSSTYTSFVTLPSASLMARGLSGTRVIVSLSLQLVDCCRQPRGYNNGLGLHCISSYFSHYEPRFYDIRDIYFTIWELNALMRLSTIDGTSG